MDVHTLMILDRRRRTGARLPLLFSAGSGNQSGVAVTSYGQGQVTGALYTVPAHGEITLDFELKLLCITPQDIQNLSSLIRSLLDASHQHLYDDVQHTDISGGASFFGIEPDGRIKEVKLVSTTGNHELDQRIEIALSSLTRMSDAPPLEMPQPVSLKIVSHT